MKTVCNLIIILCIGCGTLTAQTLNYAVIIAGKKSGTLVVEHNKTDVNNFMIRSEANFSVAFTDINSTSEVNFKNGQLHKAWVLQKMNDKVREKTDITHDGIQYHIQRKGEDVINLKNNVLYSIAMLYHTEPVGRTTAFSERYGKFCPLKKIANHQYLLDLPDGKKTTYTYKNGVCTKVQTKQMMMDVRFELLN